MATIQPISTTRVTDSMMRSRLTGQIQSDQLDLFYLQNQLSTGLRFFLPSDDAASAQRAMALQRTLERNEQSVTNIQGAQASLATAESALASVGDGLNAVRAEALGAVNTVTSEEERQQLINSIDSLLGQLTSVGNANFATNSLLGGSVRSGEVYRQVDGYVEYLGDESTIQTFVDIGTLFDQGVSGDDVFGGLSEAVRGSADLDVQLTPDTKLTQLNGGLGVDVGGSIEVIFNPTASGPSTTATIDLSAAKSVQDVARLIENGAPEGAEVTVSIEGNALRVDVANGGVTIDEVGNGSTATQLGIRSTGLPVATIDSGDLDPTIIATTQLEDLLGAKTRGRIESLGDNNDLVLTAAENGASYNGLEVTYVAGAAPGAETATVTPGSPPTLVVTIEEGVSTAADVADAINAEGTFIAELDYRDQSSAIARGTGLVTASATDLGVDFAGGSGETLDLASGLLITNGTATYTIDTSDATTVEELLSLLNDPQYGLSAEINAAGDGVDIRSRRSGADFTIAENGGELATQLGIRTYTYTTELDDFNYGAGVVVEFETNDETDPDAETRRQNSLQITVDDNGVSTDYDIDIIGISTVQDLIDRIEADTGGAVSVDLATTGNGLVITQNNLDPAEPGSGTLAYATDTLTFTADTPGAAGNVDFSVVVEDTGAAGLATSYDSATNTVTVNLGGSATETTATVAASISAAVPDYTVTATSGAPAAATLASTTVNVAGGFEADQFTVSGNVAERLGLVPEGQESVSSNGSTLTSTDTNPSQVESVFTTLIRMRDALEANDQVALEAEVARLDDDINRVTSGRAEIGVRLQDLDAYANRLSDEEVTLRSALSDEIDADLVEVISDYTAQQYALQVSLQTAGSLLNLSVLDFI